MMDIVSARKSAAAPWARRLGGFSAMLFFVAGIGHRYGLVDTVSFFWLLGLVGTLALGALAAATFAFAAIWQHGGQGLGAAIVGTFAALLVLAPFSVSLWQMATLPSLTDISTDVVDRPPLALAAAERRGAMNPVRQPTPDEVIAQMRAYPEVTGRSFTFGPEQVIAAILREIDARGWTLRMRGPSGQGDAVTVIEATAYSPMLAFASDVSIRIVDLDTATYVDMRSVSRYGRHDLGDNARRIAGFLQAVSDALKLETLVVPGEAD